MIGHELVEQASFVAIKNVGWVVMFNDRWQTNNPIVDSVLIDRSTFTSDSTKLNVVASSKSIEPTVAGFEFVARIVQLSGHLSGILLKNPSWYRNILWPLSHKPFVNIIVNPLAKIIFDFSFNLFVLIRFIVVCVFIFAFQNIGNSTDRQMKFITKITIWETTLCP